MELSEFLLARIAEDEAVARAATAAPWTVDEHSDKERPMWAVYGPIPDGERWPLDVVEVSSDRDYGNPEGGCERREDAVHIARWDPARVLAECQAKRRVVERLGRYLASSDPFEGLDEQLEYFTWETLYDLALPYSDHPDYNPAWRA